MKLRISKSYIVHVNGFSRLCADLAVENRRTTIWFGVDKSLEDCLSLGRADSFVMALLPLAMRKGYEIVCEDPMSERLFYRLTNGFVPTLASLGEYYHTISISAPLTAEGVKNQGAVGTGFSGGVDCLYTIMRHDRDSEFPLTHLAVFNTGNIRDRDALLGIFRQAEEFGAEQNLNAFFVDTDLGEILPERYGDVYTYRNLACALALQRLFKIYLVSSGPNASKLKLNLGRVSGYDLLTLNHASTESLAFYLSGVETTRAGKLEALTGWEPSRRWLHPCTGMIGEKVNCSHCKKCIRDMTILYGLGELEKYQAVFDTDDYIRHLPERMGFVLARNSGESSAQAIQVLKERNISIPPAAHVYAKQFRRAMENLKNDLEGGKQHGQ